MLHQKKLRTRLSWSFEGCEVAGFGGKYSGQYRFAVYHTIEIYWLYGLYDFIALVRNLAVASRIESPWNFHVHAKT